MSQKYIPIQERLDIFQHLIIWILITAAYTAFFHIWNPEYTCNFLTTIIILGFYPPPQNKPWRQIMLYCLKAFVYACLIYGSLYFCTQIALEFTSFFQAILKRFVTQ